MENEDLYEQAAKKVKAKKGFFYHLLAYVFTIGMFITIKLSPVHILALLAFEPACP